MTAPKPTSLLKRIARVVVTIVVTACVIGAAVGTVMFGSEAIANRANAIPDPDPAPSLPVAVQTITQTDGYTVARRFTGQIEAAFSTTLSLELGGRLTELAVQEGDSVVEGQLIARLDTALIEAEIDRLTASRAAIGDQLSFAESRLARVTSLRAQGFASQEQLDQAQATRDALRNRIIEMDAALASAQINIDKSVLFAPFDGRIGTQSIDGSESLAPGQAVVTLIKTSAPEVRVGLPLDMTPEDLAKAQVRIGDVILPAKLRQLRPDLDPVTRTRTALFTLDNDTPTVIGQTATLLIPVRVNVPGTWVPIDALQEGAGSVWTVMVVEDGHVQAAAVELLHVEDTRAYVRGSFLATSQLVRSGAHRVVVGQRVTAQLAAK